jgi:hypothetical protein
LTDKEFEDLVKLDSTDTLKKRLKLLYAYWTMATLAKWRQEQVDLRIKVCSQELTERKIREDRERG